MKAILISICIPTYNRAKYLTEALDSICSNLDKDSKDSLEVVISDNHSEDDTKRVVEGYQGRLSISYHCNDRNIGPTANLCMAATLAQGKYLWFLSDDDVLTTGALNYLMNYLRKHQRVQYIYYTRLIGDKYLHYSDIVVEPSGLSGDTLYMTGIALSAAFKGNIGIMGYYSSTIIQRELWLDNLSTYAREFNDFSHLELIFQSIHDKHCAILARPGVICRMGNFRTFAVNSLVWFDGFFNALRYAKALGYEPATIDRAINALGRGGQRMFFIDKMLGHREGSFRKVYISLGGDLRTLDKTIWYWASYLPATLLSILRPIYRAKASVYQMDSN